MFAPANCDVAIVGGGIVGLAVARELTRRRPGASVCVLEREQTIGAHQTSHNSGVIHAGVYYTPGSLKAQLCVGGARELYEYCEAHAIPVNACGKLIVATGPSELGRLEELERRARANGVPGLRRVGAREIAEIEPHARGIAALHSPHTGVVDFSMVARAYAHDVLEAGGAIATGCGITRIEHGLRMLRLLYAGGGHTGDRYPHPHPYPYPHPDHGHTGTEHAHAGYADDSRRDSGYADSEHPRARATDAIEARYAIFCAGAWADRLAVAAGADPDPRIVPFRGAYLRLIPARRSLVRSLIYPVPDPALPFLGVHLSRHIDGEVSIGPTALLAGARDAYDLGRVRARDVLDTLLWPGSWRMAARWWQTGLTELRHALSPAALVRAAARYVPELSTVDVEPAFAGVRAQALGRSGQLIDDFVFSATPRALHVRNAPSPAATSSLAIARHVVDEAQRAFGLGA